METSLTWLQQVALWAQVCFYVVTGLSVLGTGALAIVKFRSFSRAFINVSLEASSRPSSQDHVQIGVTAKLYNGSQNLAKAEQLEWECRGIATYTSEVIERKTSEYFKDAAGNSRTEFGNSEFPWNLQQRITKKGLDIAIEPNETSHDSVTFVVPTYCTAVQIRLFIPTKRKNDIGWTAVIYHDTNPTP
ncbi:MAG: hypothetical protein OXK82_12890 [Deltaproteobacteria bacterium]|nr:hypothetical protein [Deltaproteobacteria bacterium]